MQVLIAGDGSEYARGAARFACELLEGTPAEIALLGVATRQNPERRLQQRLEALRYDLEVQGARVGEIIIRHGSPAEEILAETREHPYHLVTIGSRGLRGLQAMLMGSTTRQLSGQIETSLLVVTSPRSAIRRVLICTGGGEPGKEDAFVGGALASLRKADVTVLHVMSQVAISPDARYGYLEGDADQLMQSGTREGEHLSDALEILAGWGVGSGNREAKIRRGIVVDEILHEVREGDYDLVVIGAHRKMEGQPWADLRTRLQENVAARIIEQTRRPVLVVRPAKGVDWTTLRGDEQQQGEQHAEGS
jgi:nucleotide-binding universal stress UspA family protein